MQRHPVLLTGFFIVLVFSTPGNCISTDDAVILNDDHRFEIHSATSATYIYHGVIIIYGPSGQHYGHLELFENEFHSPKKMQGCIRNLNGDIIRKLKNNEIRKDAYSEGLYADQKLWWVKLELGQFPYMVDYTIEVDIKSLFYWPDWMPQHDVPVSQSTYTLILPKNIEYRAFPVDLEVEPEIQDKGGKQVLSWTLKEIPAKINEDFLPDNAQIQKALLFAPETFDLDGTPGSNASWQKFGQWYGHLAENQYKLPEKAQQEIDSLTFPLQNVRKKIETVYRHLQNKTRYVAIHLGIGRYQPHSAASVYEHGYGDCKDLCTLLIAFLNHINIAAFPALIQTRGNHPFYPDFVSNQFNHMIACVPLDADTIWLECTSDFTQADELPYTDEYQYCLFVDKNGGKLIRTPPSQYPENNNESVLNCKIEPDGTTHFDGIYHATGNSSIYIRHGIFLAKPEDRKTMLAHWVGEFTPDISIDEYRLLNVYENLNKPLTIHYKGVCNSYAKRTSKRLFLNPNMMHRKDPSTLPHDENRTFDLEFNYPYSVNDTVIFKLPRNLQLEAIPDTTSMTAEFAFFDTDFNIQDNRLTYIRVYQLRHRYIQAALYEAYCEFMQAVVKRDRQQFVFQVKRP